MASTDWRKIIHYSALGGLCGLGAWSLVRAMSGGGSSAAEEPKDTPGEDPHPKPKPKPHPSDPSNPASHDQPSDPSQHSGAGGVCASDIPLKQPSFGEGGLSRVPDDPRQRNQYIVDVVRNGHENPIEWVPVVTQARGHTATFWVMSDSLRIAGMRVCANAATTQKVADLLGASLLTPTLADLIYANADVRLPVLDRPITNKTADMLDQSVRVDEAIALATGKTYSRDQWYMMPYPKDRGVLVANQGKHWVISPRLVETPADPYCHLDGSNMKIPRVLDRSCNYGWHKRGSKENTGTPNFSVDGKRFDVVQGQGICHDICHDDYSQLICLVRNDCSVDGQPMNFQSLLLHPELAWLASARTGAYPSAALRLPGVPARPARS